MTGTRSLPFTCETLTVLICRNLLSADHACCLAEPVSWNDRRFAFQARGGVATFIENRALKSFQFLLHAHSAIRAVFIPPTS
jgi:hypothetical protein